MFKSHKLVLAGFEPQQLVSWTVVVLGAQQSSVFTDPVSGKVYIRTKSGRIVEAQMEEEMEIYVDPITGKTYLRTKSGTLKGQFECHFCGTYPSLQRLN